MEKTQKSIKELVERFAYLGNRIEHGLINGDDFIDEMKKTATELNDILWPKVIRTTGRK